MDTTNVAAVITFVAAILPVLGVTGITPQDLTGFTNVIAGLLTLAGIIWMHVAHKKALGRALAGIR